MLIEYKFYEYFEYQKGFEHTTAAKLERKEIF